jgi:hypothetical protein
MKTLTALFSMSILVVVILVLVITTVADADVHVSGYYRSNGTYVQPHWRSDPDGNPHNNWSTYPNVNPYTGKRGTRRLSTMSNINMPSYGKPIALLSSSPSIHNHGSWSKPSPLPSPLPGPTYPDDFGRGSML